MRFDVDNLAQPGMVHDVPDQLLPSGAWTESRNVRYRDGAAEKCKGYQQALGDLSLTAIWAQTITDGSNHFVVYASNAVLYATDGTTHTNVSHASLSYVATDDLGWTGGAFHGFVLANDGLTVPQVWQPSLANDFASLTAWPSISCKVLRPFKDFIFALRITDGGNYLPRTLRWSDKAQQGSLPSSWDFQDPTNQAGITELAQTGDVLVDCAPLRDSLIIYKENHTWSADYVGGADIFGFRQVFSQIGMLTENCAATIGSSQLVLTDQDLIVHDGNAARSIADKRMRRWLFNRISSTRFRRSYIAADYRNREAYICFPEEGASWPTMALVWNWAEDTLHPFELGNPMTFATSGVVPAANSSTTFDNDSGTFDDDGATFDDDALSQFYTRMLFFDSTRKRAYQGDNGESYNGVSMFAYARRTGMTLSKDMNTLKRVKRIYPKVSGANGDTINFWIGTRETDSGQVSWDGPHVYTIGVDYKIDCRPIAGRIVDLEANYSGTNTFRFYGYSVEYDNDGTR